MYAHQTFGIYAQFMGIFHSGTDIAIMGVWDIYEKNVDLCAHLTYWLCDYIWNMTGIFVQSYMANMCTVLLVEWLM